MEYLEEQNALVKAGKLPGADYQKLTTLLIGNGWCTYTDGCNPWALCAASHTSVSQRCLAAT